jgi:hypothetical protein
MLPEDVLFIKYANVELTPDLRLCVLGAIGALLNRSIGFYTPAMLQLSADEWNHLRIWIGQGNGSQFWRLESQGVYVTRSCEQHVLVGTSQLLADLRDVRRQQPPTRQVELNDVWNAAQRYIAREIKHEAN